MKKVFLPITENEKTPYKGWINGKPFTVPRGQMVDLPDDQADVVINSQKMDGIVVLNLDKAEKEFQKDVSELGTKKAK
jgi:hypothetical protein